MRRGLKALGAIGLAATLIGSAAARAECKVGTANLPVSMEGPEAKMTLKVNGAEARFTIDSGAFYSIITPGWASQLGLKPQPAPFGLLIKGAGGLVAPQIVRVKSLGFADTSLNNILFLVDDNEVGGAGVIGENFLGLMDAEYDLANSRVALVRPYGCEGRPLAYWAKAGQNYGVLKLEPNVNPALHMIRSSIKINGVTMRALFDTGASSSILSVAAARRAGVPLEGSDVANGGITRGIGRRFISLRVSPVREVEIDNEVIKNTRIQVANLDIDQDVVLGADFFLAHHIYVANSQGRIYFTYNGGPVFNLTTPPPASAGATTTAAEADPADAAGLARRAAVRFARRDYTGARTDLDKAVALDPKSANNRLHRAQALLALKQTAEAQADLDAAVDLAPKDAEIRLLRARVRIARKAYPDARADLDAAGNALAPQSDQRYMSGLLRLAVDDPNGAVADFDSWLSFHGQDNRRPGALTSRCWARVLAGTDLAKAGLDCDAAHRAAPRSERVLVVRALLRLRQGNSAAAKADLAAAQAINPKSTASLWRFCLEKAPWAKEAAREIGPKPANEAPKPIEDADEEG